MSLMIKGMELPQHAAVNGEKDTVYKCAILAHPDNTVELVIDTEFASVYDNGHNIQRYPITEIPTPHGRLIDADDLDSITVVSYPNTGDPFVAGRLKKIIAPTIIEAEENDEK